MHSKGEKGGVSCLARSYSARSVQEGEAIFFHFQTIDMNMRKQASKKTAKVKTKTTKVKTAKAKATKTVRAKKPAAKKEMEVQPVLDYDQLRKAVFVLRSINHGFRQKILSLLYIHGKASVTDIYRKLRVEQSVASQHLAILRREGIIEREREGKFIYYFLNLKRLKELASLIEKLAAPH